MTRSTEEKIQQLQIIEQNIQNILMQKQQFQTQMQEIESAIEETEGKDHAYKIIGNIMVKADAPKLKEELDNKKEMTSLRIQSIEKQEKAIRDKAAMLKQEVMEEMKGAQK